MNDIPPSRCRTGDPDNGGNCTTCVEYRRLRQAAREARR